MRNRHPWIVGGMFLILAGCGGIMKAQYPVYPYERDDEPAELVEVTSGEFTMKLPPGWEPAPYLGESEEIQAAFVKPGTSLEVKVYGMKQITGLRAVRIEDAQTIMRNSLPGSVPSRIAGPYAISDSVFAPIFEYYRVRVVEKGQEEHLGAYTGFNLARTVSYGVSMVGDQEEIEAAEPAFRAMLAAF